MSLSHSNLDEWLIPTNSGVESDGFTHFAGMKLQGNLALPIVFSMIFSTVLFLILMGSKSAQDWGYARKILVAILPSLLVGSYVFAFLNNRPPRYAKDLFETWSYGNKFNIRPRHRVKVIHPLSELILDSE